jgi:hypothetical protein
MKNINIGIVKSLISNRLGESYLSSDSIDETKGLASEFFDVVKDSPILQLELKVFENLDRKKIENDIIATRYIDNNVKLFEKFSFDEIKKEHEKLRKFVAEKKLKVVDTGKNLLFESINNLILQSVCNCDDVDIDLVHESFENVLNHMKVAKQPIVESVDNGEVIDDSVIEIAIGKFNHKYDSLIEEDISLIKTLVESTIDEKKILLESYKEKSLKKLQSVEAEGIETKINESIEKIKTINFNPETINDDIINLHELNKALV